MNVSWFKRLDALLFGRRQRVRRRRSAWPRCRYEQIEPRLLLSATAESTTIATISPQSGFIDIGPLVQFSTAAEHVAPSGPWTPTSANSPPGTVHYLPPPAVSQPKPADPPGGGGFVPVDQDPPAEERRRGAAEEPAPPKSKAAPMPPTIAGATPKFATNAARAASTTGAVSLSAAVALQPARGHSETFELASSLSPNIARVVHRVNPPLPHVLERSPPVPAALLASNSLETDGAALSSSGEISAATTADDLLLAACQTAPQPTDLYFAALAREKSFEAGDIASDLSHAEVDELALATLSNSVDALLPCNAALLDPTPAGSERNRSQAALAIALTILAYQASAEYFSPANGLGPAVQRLRKWAR